MQSIVFWLSLATALLLRSEVTVYYYCKLPRSDTYVIHTYASKLDTIDVSNDDRSRKIWPRDTSRGTNNQSGIDVSVVELLGLCSHVFIRLFYSFLLSFSFLPNYSAWSLKDK